MRLLLQYLILIGFAGPAFSSSPGTLSGSCTIAGTTESKTVLFRVASNEKAVIGYLGSDNGHYKITVVNNTGLGEIEKTWGSLAIGFARDRAPFGNPPVACPEGRREWCEEVNRRNNPPFEYAPSDRFIVVLNDGYADSEPILHTPQEQEGFPNGFSFYKVMFGENQVSGDFKFSTPVAPLGGVRTSCSASFRTFGD